MGREIDQITSGSNVRIRHLKELQAKGKIRRETGTFVAEGRKMVEEACRLGLACQLYFSESSLEESYGSRPPDWAEGLPCAVVADSVFRSVSDTTTPQGVLAVVKQSEFSLDEILRRKRLRLLILEDIRDPGNLGTMLRTAEGAGMDALILSKGTVDLYHPKVVRSTMGSIFRVPAFYTEDLEEQLKRFRGEGIRLCAAHLKGNAGYDEIAYPNRCGVLIGNEANGLSDRIASLADLYVRIPMAGQVESLNAAVAAALLMYRMGPGEEKSK